MDRVAKDPIIPGIPRHEQEGIEKASELASKLQCSPKDIYRARERLAADVQFWVSRLVSEFNRMGQRRPSDRLQAVLLLDEADLYLPANAQPASKQPVEDLLRRGRSAGLGVFLATQSPGDLDYRCRDNVISWFIGRVGQRTAMAKLEPLFEGRNGSVQALPQQDVGQFHYVGERSLERLQFTRNLIRLPAQVSDAEILSLAARGRKAGKADTVPAPVGAA